MFEYNDQELAIEVTDEIVSALISSGKLTALELIEEKHKSLLSVWPYTVVAGGHFCDDSIYYFIIEKNCEIEKGKKDLISFLSELNISIQESDINLMQVNHI